MKNTNGPEPDLGAWVYASTGLCPSRYVFERRDDGWYDPHGCRERWSDLVDPIDTLAPEKV